MADNSQCNGFRSYGGAFKVQPVIWERCREKAVFEVKCGEGNYKLFLCPECWAEFELGGGTIKPETQS